MDAVAQALEKARQEAAGRGFHHTGIYHLLWVIWKNQPELLRAWLEAYQVPQGAFVKMIETLLRPRRAGGGLARDRQDAQLLEEALQLVSWWEKQHGRKAGLDVLAELFPRLSEDPVVSLCHRFELPCRPISA